MKESNVWIVVIGAVAIAGIGFASLAKETQVAVLIGGFASSICVSLLTYLQAHKTAIKAEVAANLVQENAVAVDEKLVQLTDVVSETKKTLETVETQTNSATGALLRRSAEILRSFANKSKDPKDEEVAISAEKDYAQHERGQAIIAAAAGKPPLLGVEKRLDAAAGLMGVIGASPPTPGREAMEKTIPEGTTGKEEKP